MSSTFVTYSQKTLGIGNDGKEEDVIDRKQRRKILKKYCANGGS